MKIHTITKDPQIREAFEKWASVYYREGEVFPKLRRNLDGYHYSSVQASWMAWQAATEQLATELKQLRAEREDVQYVWLIEKGDSASPEYLYYGFCFEWTKDPYKALWFIRRSDADAVGGESLDDVRIVQHGFDIESRLTQTQNQQKGTDNE